MADLIDRHSSIPVEQRAIVLTVVTIESAQAEIGRPAAAVSHIPEVIRVRPTRRIVFKEDIGIDVGALRPDFVKRKKHRGEKREREREKRERKKGGREME